MLTLRGIINLPPRQPRFLVRLPRWQLIIRNRLWNTGAVTQESLQNRSLGKSLYILELKKNKVLLVLSG